MASRLRIFLMVLLVGMLVSVPMSAGSAVVGSVAGSLNASVGVEPLLPNTTIFSGESLQVKEGVAVVTLDNGNRVTLGKDTVATFQRDGDGVTVLLKQGAVSLFRPDTRTALKVQIGHVTAEPEPGFKTLGDVAAVNGTIVVTAKDGVLRVNDGAGRTTEVRKGKTIALKPKTARAPQAPGSQPIGGTSTMTYILLGAAGVGAGFGIASFVEAKDAKDNAALAIATANSVGCTLNKITAGYPASAYTPPPGYKCP